jgi:hypothetical protein
MADSKRYFKLIVYRNDYTWIVFAAVCSEADTKGGSSQLIGIYESESAAYDGALHYGLALEHLGHSVKDAE